LRRAGAVLVLLAVTASTLLGLAAGTPVATAASHPQAVPLLSDDFANDTALNPNLWQVNGPIGVDFGNSTCPSCTLITLVPSFSSSGMEIAQINGSNEVGTIQSIQSFAAPLTVNVSVKGTVSNGHPFVFGIASANASSGVEITGNLDPHDCSAETNCGDPSTCGTSTNASIPPNQCYYGIYARAGTGAGHWPKTPTLVSSPSVDTTYALQISVDSSGTAQFSVSQGGQVLGTSTSPVGMGPFYIVIAQSEGAPVPGHGPNQAYWTSVSVVPSSPPVTGSSPSSSGPPWTWIVIVIVVLVVVILILLAVVGRGRNFLVMVVDSRAQTPIPGAMVSAEGPKKLSGVTGKEGWVKFGGVTSGDYLVTATATAYSPSTPTPVQVKGGTKHTVSLEPVVPPTPRGQDARAPPTGPAGGVPPIVGGVPPPPAMGVTPPPPGAAPTAPPETDDLEGVGGERIQHIIRTFQAKGAISPETALTAKELGLSRLFVRIMKRRQGRTKVFIEVDGKYYLDQAALQKYR
jgi:hypothetical protein